MMYAWAAPEYILDQMSMEQVMMYYEKGVKAVELQAKVFWSVLGQAMSGESGSESEKVSDNSDKPDLKRFHEIYGNVIKRSVSTAAP
ncbi:MAG: hypothetical protein Q8J68_08975 [Methanolobus sp.]|uniref:hypothetical protein n=1 Tax=Methanolobus sp. TaxID=1874737 RepID=UPI00272FDE18|nr:hypothetical protein [Methanolobus sp.]MDP2217405.1 hypothetical protein [Methanolobus sp.]